MNVLPGKPEDVIIFYGQARSIVRYMIGVFGPSKMKELMATMKSGVNVDDALQAVYGFDRLELDAQWRRAIRAPSYVPPESGRSRPTPIPLPTVGLYTLTPQADTSGIGDQSDPSTPTAMPEPTATPEPTPTEVTVAIASEDTGASQQTTEPAGEERPEPVPGGGCNGPIRGAGRTTEASFIGLLAMIAWLGFRRVRGR